MRNKRSFGRLWAVRVLASVVVLVLFTVTAQAYTIILRGGKSIVIPDTFTATATTLTYELSAGFQATIQISAIDVIATDRANREPAGSFLKRLELNRLRTAEAAVAKGPGPIRKDTATQERTVTNRDLESYSRKRREGELAYERRRQELGLPSAEESRRQAQIQAELLRQRFEQTQAEERSNQAYWRERALALRSDMAAADAEINAIRQQLDWLPANSYFTSLGGVDGIGPFLGFGQSAVNPSLLAPNVPNILVTPQLGLPAANVGGLTFQARGGGGSGRVSVGHGFRAGVGHGFRHGAGPGFRRGVANGGFSPGFILGAYQPYDLSYERTVLRNRLHEVVARRAALGARFRTLEEEARRAGVPPGWLR